MGMFDYIRCQYPLPEGSIFPVTAESRMQTKDLSLTMDHYVIGADGKLYIEVCKWVDNPDYEDPGPMETWPQATPGKMNWDWLQRSNPGWLEPTGELAEYTCHYGQPMHGILLMYASERINDKYEFSNYYVTFTHGIVEEIEFSKERR